jgi:hypothetical protein
MDARVKPAQDERETRAAILETHLRLLAARRARGLREFSAPRKRGRGECRVPSAPAASYAHIGSEYAYEYSQRGHRNHPAFPHAMGYGLYVISPVIGLSCHRRLANIWQRPPGRARATSARLDAGVEASGPHDFAVRISVARLRALRSLTGNRPAIASARTTLPRPPHPAPTFVTMANAPLPEQDGVDIG